MTYGDEVAKKLAGVSRVSSVVGVFVAMVDGLARVNLQGSTIDIRCDGWNPPVPGMPVRVEVVNSIMRVVGPSQALTPRGQVLETLDGGIRARVQVGAEQYVLPVMAPYSPLATDVVVISWQSGHILGEEAAAPEAEEPPPVGGGRAPFDGLLIQPTASGKFDTSWGNWWAPPEVWASNNNEGIWVYSGRLGALAGADITSAEFFFPPPVKITGAAYIGLHAYPNIPGGNPDIVELTFLPADRRSGWYRLPDGWGQALRDNPTWGIGVTSGAGDNRWPGVGQAGGGQSGWLRFAGSR